MPSCIFTVGRDPQGPLSPAQDTPENPTLPESVEFCQLWDCDHCIEEPIPLSDHPLKEGCFPHILANLPDTASLESCHWSPKSSLPPLVLNSPIFSWLKKSMASTVPHPFCFTPCISLVRCSPDTLRDLSQLLRSFSSKAWVTGENPG